MTRILAAEWVLPISFPPISNGALAIQDDLIVSVGTLNRVRGEFPDAPVSDFERAALLPGFVNVHTHLELTRFRDTLEIADFPAWITELVRRKREETTREDLLASARLGCGEAIKSGITTVADTAESDVVFPALVESGLRGVLYQECFGPDPRVAEESIRTLSEKLDAMKDRPSRIRIGISPHAPYTVSAELYRRATALAVDRGVDLGLHVAESDDELEFMTDGSGAFSSALKKREIAWNPPGVSTIEYLNNLGVLEAGPLLIHCVQASRSDFELMAANGARLAHCPKSNAKFGHGIADLIEARKAGVVSGLGSDSVASNNTCDLIEEGRFCALFHRAAKRDASLLPAPEVLRLMTLDGARALKWDDAIGSLEAGKKADVIAIRLDKTSDPETSIVFSSSRSDVVMTMVDGAELRSAALRI